MCWVGRGGRQCTTSTSPATRACTPPYKIDGPACLPGWLAGWLLACISLSRSCRLCVSLSVSAAAPRLTCCWFMAPEILTRRTPARSRLAATALGDHERSPPRNGALTIVAQHSGSRRARAERRQSDRMRRGAARRGVGLSRNEAERATWRRQRPAWRKRRRRDGRNARRRLTKDGRRRLRQLHSVNDSQRRHGGEEIDCRRRRQQQQQQQQYWAPQWRWEWRRARVRPRDPHDTTTSNKPTRWPGRRPFPTSHSCCLICGQLVFVTAPLPGRRTFVGAHRQIFTLYRTKRNSS